MNIIGKQKKLAGIQHRIEAIYGINAKLIIKYSVSELINVCLSNNFMEQQAYKMSKEIQNNSLYKVVRAEDSEGNDLIPRLHDKQWDGKDFITKIILEDKKGIIILLNLIIMD